jgi:hypothetical protein
MEKVTTDAVTALVDMWVTRVLATLDDEKAEIVNRVVNGDPNADLQVVFKLKQGVVLLEAERSDGKFELYRVDVEPLRPSGGFAELVSRAGH